MCYIYSLNFAQRSYIGMSARGAVYLDKQWLGAFQTKVIMYVLYHQDTLIICRTQKDAKYPGSTLANKSCTWCVLHYQVRHVLYVIVEVLQNVHT